MYASISYYKTDLLFYILLFTKCYCLNYTKRKGITKYEHVFLEIEFGFYKY